MENQIFAIESTFWKSIVIKENEFWLSQNKVNNLEKFEQAVQKEGGLMKSAYAYPLSAITEISFNEASEGVKIKYQDEKGKENKVNMGFGDENLSNRFGHTLGDKLGFTKNQRQEGQIKPLLLNALYLVIAIGVTTFLATIDDTNELANGSTRRSRGGGAIAKLIVDTIGQMGVIIIGVLASLYLAYQLYKRYTNPANEIVYQK